VLGTLVLEVIVGVPVVVPYVLVTLVVGHESHRTGHLALTIESVHRRLRSEVQNSGLSPIPLQV